jgi:UDP-glucose 4-epimerase
MKALVTGGAGFIGSHLVDFLVEKDYEVMVIDNESSNSGQFYWNTKAINYKLDIRDYDKTKTLYQGCDYVFHLAAETRIQASIINPIDTVSVNSLGTCVVLQCSRESNVKRLIFSSTSAIYGNNSVPNYENQINNCLNPYSTSKLHGEILCKLYSSQYGLDTVVLRYFNVFGDRQPTKGSYTPVVGVFLTQRSLNKPLTIVGDGNRRRDYVHVSDVVNANFLAATSAISVNDLGGVFNVGFGTNYSVNELAKLISSEFEFITDRVGEADSTLANIGKITNILGWTPKIALRDWLKTF